MSEGLIALYPNEKISRIAEIMGMSEATVKRMARQLGLKKPSRYRNMSQSQKDIIISSFYKCSLSEIVSKTGCSRKNIMMFAREQGLKRTKEQNRAIMSRIRSEIIKKERRRVLFGLDPITNIKVVTNRAKIHMRHWFKRAGYIVERCSSIIFYHSGVVRNLRQEMAAYKLGLRFEPLKVYSL